jgi:hypothetical protein
MLLVGANPQSPSLNDAALFFQSDYFLLLVLKLLKDKVLKLLHEPIAKALAPFALILLSSE